MAGTRLPSWWSRTTPLNVTNPPALGCSTARISSASSSSASWTLISTGPGLSLPASSFQRPARNWRHEHQLLAVPELRLGPDELGVDGHQRRAAHGLHLGEALGHPIEHVQRGAVGGHVQLDAAGTGKLPIPGKEAHLDVHFPWRS